jgi:hypothetical protein
MRCLKIPREALSILATHEMYCLINELKDVIKEMGSFEIEFMEKYTPSQTDLTDKNLAPLGVLKQLHDVEEIALRSLAALGLCCFYNYEQLAGYNYLPEAIIDEIRGKSSEITTVIVFHPYDGLLASLFVVITAIFKNAKNNGSAITNEDISKMLFKILKSLKQLEYDVETFVAINLIVLGGGTLESISIYSQQMQCN